MHGKSAHDERREKILEATWRLIARDGLQGTSMRALAAEAGYANGALSHYFAGKDALLRAVYEYVLRQTMARIAERTQGLSGLAGLRAFIAEIIPDDDLKRLEARVVVPFWTTALVEPGFSELFVGDVADWRKHMRRYLRQAVELGELEPPADAGEHARIVESLLAMLSGMQVLALLCPKQHSPRVMRDMVDQFLSDLSGR